MSRAGTLLGDRYRVGAKIGVGGMGVVHAAVDEITGRAVAIKILRGAAAGAEGAFQRFEREARATLVVHHPNVVQVSDVGTSDDGLPYYVMEQLRGRSLGAAVRAGGRLPASRVVRIALQVASALVAAHAAGVIHRDIKPDNVFLCDTDLADDVVKLLDFGVAKVVDKTDLTAAGSIVGTLAYMAPEQARGDAVDGRADLYALGACMYLALTGVKPFAEKSPQALLTALFTAEPTPLESIAGDVPPELCAIVRRAMAKDPRARYASAAELRDALERLGTMGATHFEPAPVTLRLSSPTPTPPPKPPNDAPTLMSEGADRTTTPGLSRSSRVTGPLPPPPSRESERRTTLLRRVFGVVALAVTSGIAFDLVTRRFDAPPPPSPSVAPLVASEQPKPLASDAPLPSAVDAATPMASAAPTVTHRSSGPVTVGSVAASASAEPAFVESAEQAALLDAAGRHDPAACTLHYDRLLSHLGTNATKAWSRKYEQCLMESGRCADGRAQRFRELAVDAVRVSAERENEVVEVDAITWCPSSQWTDAERGRRYSLDLSYARERHDPPADVAKLADRLLPLVPKLTAGHWSAADTQRSALALIKLSYVEAGRCADAARIPPKASLSGACASFSP